MQQSYLLRLWKDSADGYWRASLKDLMSLEVTHFPNLEGVYEYICNQTHEPVWNDYMPINKDYESE